MRRAPDVMSDASGGKQLFARHFRMRDLAPKRGRVDAMTLDPQHVVGFLPVHLRVDAVTRGIREDLEGLADAIPKLLPSSTNGPTAQK